jgi:zona occludens toxin
MIFVITGSPGAGKSLFLIDTLKDTHDRTIYYHGINNLKLDWIELDDPLNFHTELEEGSIVVLDEAQKTFPVRDYKKDKPEALSFLETHRHHGVDIYFITQHASMLDIHIRRLTGTHIHLNRNFGANYATKYTANSVIDPKNYHELKTAEKSIFRYPKKTFDLYKSAEVHTHKKKIPLMLFLIPLGIVIIYYLFNSLTDTLGITEPEETIATEEKTFDLLPGSLPGRSRDELTLKDLTPKYPSIPESAPAYASLWQPVTFPKLNCISSKTRCHCYTQQGTYYKVSEEICRNRIQFGYFDITKAETENHDNNQQNTNDNSKNSLLPTSQKTFRSSKLEYSKTANVKL